MTNIDGHVMSAARVAFLVSRAVVRNARGDQAAPGGRATRLVNRVGHLAIERASAAGASEPMWRAVY
jgi:hypothetical protein